jgi:alpha-tubulin suppressor-like RCC1 family protein
MSFISNSEGGDLESLYLTKTVLKGYLTSNPGTLMACGYNYFGSMLNNPTKVSSPVQVGSISNWVKLDACADSVHAIRKDGTLWTCGYNYLSGLAGTGNNSTGYGGSELTQVGALSNWKDVAGGYGMNAIKTDGTLWTWGGTAGNSLSGGKSSPVQVGALTNWSKLFGSAYSLSIFALKTDGTMWVAGGNVGGQLGLGNINIQQSPVQLGAANDWKSASSGASPSTAAVHTLLIKPDGTLWATGTNDFGQLGDGTTVAKSSPIQVGSSTWVSAAGGLGMSVGVKTDGTLWAWGYNANGSLGVGDIVTRSTPVQVGSLTNWLKVSAAGFVSAIKTDGTLWAWGANSTGNLGLGDIINRSSPVQVGSLQNWTAIYNSRRAMYMLQG